MSAVKIPEEKMYTKKKNDLGNNINFVYKFIFNTF